MIDLKPILQHGIRAVRQACDVTSRVQAEKAETHVKEDRSPVTTADMSAQVIVNNVLADTTPGFSMISEESAKELQDTDNPNLMTDIIKYAGEHVPDLSSDKVYELLDHGKTAESEYSWVLDPVDGTKGFLRGDQYAIALALMHKGEVVIGIMGCPNFETGAGRNGQVFFAAKGQGAWQKSIADGNLGVLKRSEDANQANAILAKGVEAGHHNFGIMDSVVAALGTTTDPIRMDGQGKYACVAGGHAMAYLRAPRPGSTRKECIWDHAAGVIIVEEAGGTVTDVTGTKLDFSLGRNLENNTGIIASHGLYHDELVEYLTKARAAAGEA